MRFGGTTKVVAMRMLKYDRTSEWDATSSSPAMTDALQSGRRPRAHDEINASVSNPGGQPGGVNLSSG